MEGKQGTPIWMPVGEEEEEEEDDEFDHLFLEDDPDVEPPISFEDSWAVFEAHFKEYGFAHSQIRSFEQFVGQTMQEIIDAVPLITETCENPSSCHYGATHQVRLGKVSLSKALVHEGSSTRNSELAYDAGSDLLNNTLSIPLPDTVRKRNMPLSGHLYIEVTQRITRDLSDGGKHEDTIIHPAVKLGDLLLMVGSKYCPLSDVTELLREEKGECPMDQGGFFIVNGGEKVIIGQERMQYNHVFVFQKSASGSRSLVTAEVRCLAEGSHTIPSIVSIKNKMFKGRSAETMRVSIPFIRQMVSVGILFKAMGVMTDKDMCFMVAGGLEDTEMLNAFVPSILESYTVRTTEDALDYIASRSNFIKENRDDRIKYASDLLNDRVFPQMGNQPGLLRNKAHLLGHMVNRLLSVRLGRNAPDDRDHLAHKSIDLAGPLMASLFTNFITKKIVKGLKNDLKKHLNDGGPINIPAFVKHKHITQGFRFHLSTGNWSLNKTAGAKKGVSAHRLILSHLSSVSHIGRLNTPIGREGKLSKPRQLNQPQIFRCCPAETPEGSSCGLSKNIAILGHVSVGSSSFPMMDLVETYGTKRLEACTPEEIEKQAMVFVNGNWFGMTADPKGLTEKLRTMRRSLDISYETSIAWHISKRMVVINTQAGRLLRPLLIVCPDGKLFLTKERVERLTGRKDPIFQDGWYRLMLEGCVEFLDVEEEDTRMVAMYAKDLVVKKDQGYTHCEIHPATMLGISASFIPFSNHNPAPRCSYQAAMGKQAIGIYDTRFLDRLDTMSHVLYYPQKPIVTTRPSQIMGLDEMGPGQNAVVLIKTDGGYEQEDAVILSQSSIDMGMFRSTFYRTYKDDEKKLGNHHSEQFEKPIRESCMGMRKWNYDQLDVDGFITPGSRVGADSVIVGKTSPYFSTQPNSPFTRKDHSMANRCTETGIVDKVMLTTNQEGFNSVKVRVRSVRIPQIGDKFSSRHGQKGVCGMIYRKEDLPFNRQGITPDIIINPHALPSRMTIGQLLESLFGKAACLEGKIADGTPFQPHPTEEAEKVLLAHGFERNGHEVFMSGVTGEVIQGARVFSAICYYQRLKHLVEDKSK